ncbi:uncharacterized PPE family protein PPE40-like [Galleria mellonella]|uniref:Uncharacterized PPE family protein PPE40-like n=1 Tax=Galleria mellonella TaxID=7137 RepID=A0A6J3CD21_GALME|nr:uncharacterized PPE family protein PPE40-like [Galleria mellonella]
MSCFTVLLVLFQACFIQNAFSQCNTIGGCPNIGSKDVNPFGLGLTGLGDFGAIRHGFGNTLGLEVNTAGLGNLGLGFDSKINTANLLGTTGLGELNTVALGGIDVAKFGFGNTGIGSFGAAEITTAPVAAVNAGLGFDNIGIGITEVGFASHGIVPPGAAYGGTGNGAIGVGGNFPVTGVTSVNGQVPVIGFVEFSGDIPASGLIFASGNCDCNNYYKLY